MVYKDEVVVPDPLYEEIFWICYKEYIIAMNSLGLVNLDDEVFYMRKIVYRLIIVVPIMLFAGILTLASLVTILIFFQL